MKSLLLVSLAMFATACSGPVSADDPAPEPVVEAAEEIAPEPSPAPYAQIVFEGQTATESEREACTAAGGEIVPSGKLQWENCVQTFADAGKACAGEADCIGECRYEGEEVDPGSAVAGTCQATDAKFGCRTVVEGGVIAHTLCVD
jgi:hypothetical protein